jgi:hypothetical protein
VTRIAGHMRCIHDGEPVRTGEPETAPVVGYHLRVSRDGVIVGDETVRDPNYWRVRLRFRELIDEARGGPEPYLPPVTPPPTL